jgi:transporter family-2 protein
MILCGAVLPACAENRSGKAPRPGSSLLCDGAEAHAVEFTSRSANLGRPASEGLLQALIVPLIVLAGAMQAFAAVMGAQLRVALVNVWLATFVVFAINAFFFATAFAIRPLPLPSLESVAAMPWWAPLSGLIGAVAGFVGILFVDKVGAGPFNGILVTANLIASLAIDHFGWFGAPHHPINFGRIAGGVLLLAGVALIKLY